MILYVNQDSFGQLGAWSRLSALTVAASSARYFPLRVTKILSWLVVLMHARGLKDLLSIAPPAQLLVSQPPPPRIHLHVEQAQAQRGVLLWQHKQTKTVS